MSTITTINSTDVVADSRAVINTNFANLNTDKIELSAGGTTLSSIGNVDLILKTGNTTTGNITITDGANGAINLAPNGTGEAQVSGNKIWHDGDHITVYKSADETVNNSATLQDDDVLTFAIGANEVWAFKLYIIHISGATPDLKYAWSLPASCTMKYYDWFNLGLVDEADVVGISGTGLENATFAEGTIFNSATAGSVTFQWAQTTADVSDTKVLAGSYIIAHKLA